MKHVFLIHSHITFLVSMGTIELLRIDPKDIIFLYGRNYNISCVSIPYKTIDISNIYKPFANFNWSFSIQNQYINTIDTFVSTYISVPYYLYIPHTAFAIFQILLTNELCKGLNLIQEGAVTYFKRNFKLKIFLKNISTIVNRKRIWFQCNWNIPNRFYFEKEVVRTFACSKNYYKSLRSAQNYIINIPQYQLTIKINSFYPIFVFETAVEVHLIEKEIYMNACKKMIAECAENNNYIKFHPNQNEENKELIRSFFGKKSFQELPMDVPFELILSSYKNLTVCGFTSSLMFFAKELKHKTINYTEELTRNSKKFAKYVSSMNYE